MLSRRLATQAVRATGSRTAAANSRAYAQVAPAASSASTKPPIALFAIDGTYASALYTAAAKTSSLEPTAKALSSLSALFKRDVKLPAILAAPSLTANDKSQIIAELSKQAMGGSNAQPPETIRNFLKTLADNNRLNVLQGVCEKFEQLIGVYRGEVECVVTSASQLDAKTISRLEAAVSKSAHIGAGKKLKLTNKVNSDILGGLIVEVEGRTIDLSVSSKVAKMNKVLTDAL
ncbi:MAG: ATP synthase F0 subcomplex subunit OSCP atp5 [Sarcosagium campestre]|nr:MAG: ATP synthase F0 subcomplex subunit OSCP atp5 [Sarcosagium campestre]